MFPQRVVALSGIISVLLSAGAAAGDLKLDSREYKLMLDPEKLAAKDLGKAVDDFWDGKLTKIISEEMDKRKNGKSRHKGSFDESKQRQIVFRDTQSCLLNSLGFAFRERIKIKKGKPDLDSREVTLKLRTPDIFVAAGAQPGDGPKAKFEEDIAPLLVRTISASGKNTAAFAQPPSMRSLFSVSITHDVERDDRFQTLGDVAALYPDLKDRLEQPSVKADAGTKLIEGDKFHEFVFSGASVDLGHKVDAEFDLTLWFRDGSAGAVPASAELSFKYGVEDGQVTGEVAGRALLLFKALQTRLDDWASPERETKTSIALPSSCH